MRSSVCVFIVGVAGFVAIGSACSSDLAVDKKDLAADVKTQLAGQVGHPPESVTCPNDLPGKVGATTVCRLADAGENYGVTVTVTTVNGREVKYDIKVDEHPS